MSARVKRSSKPEEFEDSTRAPLRRIALTAPQRRLLAKAVRYDKVHFNGHTERSADTLTDWGFVTQHNERGRNPHVRPTKRGALWLKMFGRDAAKALADAEAAAMARVPK